MRDTLNRAFANADARIKAASDTRAPSDHPLLLAANSTNLGRDQSSEFRRIEEYYEHHRGRVYSAIQIPARRIAGQNFYVGRINSRSAGRRSLKYLLKEGAQITVPACMKRIDPGRLEIIDGHPLAQAIEQPNEMMTRWTLFYTTVISLMLTGRAVWPFSIEKGELRIAPVPTAWASPKHENGLFSSWEIGPPGSMKPPIEWPGEFVAHFFFPDPSNPLQPLSPVKMLARSILADEAIDTAQQVGFRNGIHPTVALIAGGGISGTKDRPIRLQPHQRNQLINWIKQEYVGVQRYNLPIVLDDIIRDVKMLSSKPTEMGFLDSSSVTESQIYMGMGVNPISAGKVQDVNRASSAMAEHHLAGNTVNPIIDMFSESLNKTLVPMFSRKNERLRAWIAPSTPKDAELRLRKFALGLKYGSVLRNEHRRELDLPPLEDGDNYALNANMEIHPGIPQNGKARKRWQRLHS